MADQVPARWRSARVVALVGVIAAAVMSCSDGGSRHGVDYVTDATIGTYNPGTVTGAAGGALMAFTRTVVGFSYLDRDGRAVPDTDVGTARVVPGAASGRTGDRLRIRYDLNPAAVFSDDVALDCDDLVLAWAANSGRFPGFTPSTTAGYRDIDSVDCTDGSRSATVTFAAGRNYRDWRALFGAGTLLPAHVAARAAGVRSVVEPIRSGATATIATIAKFWNTGWDLPKSGPVDRARFPSAGPYRLDSIGRDGQIELADNPTWWGERPQESAVTVWPRGTAGSAVVSRGEAEVVDLAAGTYGDAGGVGSSPPATSPPATTAAPSTQASGPGIDQIVFASGGVFADARARRGVAACVPRDRLATDHGYGAAVWNMHLIGPGDVAAAALNAQYGSEFGRADIARARAEVRGPITVRIGYVEPDARRAAMIGAIAASCADAGVRIEAVPQARAELNATTDAVLVSTGASAAASGALDPTRDSYAWVADDPADIDRFTDPVVSTAIGRLAVTDDEGQRLDLVRSVENALWTTLPSLPLFATPRTRGGSAAMTAVVPGVARSGTGWNMDRWRRD